LEQSEEWVLFSPTAPSATARTQTTSTERTPRTAGLSHLSDFGSLDTAARSEQDDDEGTCQGTEEEEELDSLDDGLHAFHEPSEYGGPSSRILQNSDTVLPTHDGLGTFQPDADIQEHMWQFERAAPRRRQARRRSSIQRRFDALAETDDMTQEQERRQRIEKWRLEQSKALLEEVERETRRRRRMSLVSAARSRTDSAYEATGSVLSHAEKSTADVQNEPSDKSTEDSSFWQRLTRRVIRDLMGIDEDMLSVIFGESLPEEAMTTNLETPRRRPSIDATVSNLKEAPVPDDGWQNRLLERVARELGILVHQLSEHPGAFSTYQLTQESPAYAGLRTSRPSTTLATDLDSSPRRTSDHSSSSAHFAPSFPVQKPSVAAHTYSEASLWGIEEEPESVDPLDSFRTPKSTAPVNHAEENAQEQAYWERELDVKMVFNFLVKRFSSRRPSISSPPPPPLRASSALDSSTNNEYSSARRAAIIRHHHPLINQDNCDKENVLPTSSSQTHGSNKRKEAVLKTYYQHPPPSLRSQVLRSSSSCASHSTKKSKRSGSGLGAAGRNYWDMSGSVGSGSVIAGEV
jgi:hypothetical protein